MKLINIKVRAAKRAVYVIIPLVLINTSLAKIISEQIATTANATEIVKNETLTVSTESELTLENSPESKVPAEESYEITTYTVVSGDTLSQIAEKFDISINTIRWANNLPINAQIKVGQKLTILPVTGVKYTVKSGDTISGIASKFDADQAEILDFNDLDNANKIKPGLDLIIPDAEPLVVSTIKSSSPSSPIVKSATQVQTEDGYYINPIPGSVLTQGTHGYNGVDFGAPIGTHVVASASGEVIVAKDASKWNGGYGYYVVIKHGNGTQTLYAHLSEILVEVGQTVTQGELIALSGNTGRSTGPHLHFEVRGAKNPFSSYKKYTQF